MSFIQMRLNSFASEEIEYEIVLKNANGEELAEIPIQYIKNFQFKFNDISAITLEVPKFIPSHEKKLVENQLYEQLTKGRIIQINDLYAFRILNFKETDKGTYNCKKELTCNTIEKRFERKKFTMNTGITRQIVKDNEDEAHQSEGIIDIFKSENKGWKLGYLDKDARDDLINGEYVRKYRWFDVVDKSWYSFIKDDCTAAYKSLWIFDSVNKLINIYSENNVGEDSGLYLSRESFVKLINKNTNNDSCITRLRVTGKDGMTIHNVNPIGTGYVESFDGVKDAMSEELQLALDKYNTLLIDVNKQWLILKNALLDKEIELREQKDLLTAKKEALRGKEAIRSGYIAGGGHENLSKIISEIEILEKEIKSINDKIGHPGEVDKDITATGIYLQIENINKEISIVVAKTNKDSCYINDDVNNKIFTNELLEELECFIEEDTWNGSSYLTEDALYRAALEELKERQKPTIEFEVDVNDFLSSVKHPTGWNSVMKLGDFCWIDSNHFGEVRLRLIEINHSPNEKNLKLTFSNKPIKNPPLKLGNAMSSINSSKVVLERRNIWEQEFQANKDFVMNFRDGVLDLATYRVLSRDGNQIIYIDEYGVMLVQSDNRNNQMCITNGILAITTDGWRTTKTAIMPEGVTAETLVGKILVGNELYISNSDNDFFIDNEGIKIDANKFILRSGSDVNSVDRFIESKIEVAEDNIYLGVSERGSINLIKNGYLRNKNKDFWTLDDGLSWYENGTTLAIKNSSTSEKFLWSNAIDMNKVTSRVLSFACSMSVETNVKGSDIYLIGSTGTNISYDWTKPIKLGIVGSNQILKLENIEVPSNIKTIWVRIDHNGYTSSANNAIYIDYVNLVQGKVSVVGEIPDNGNLESFIKVTKEAIESKVSKNNIGTIVTQNAESWNLSVNGKLSGKSYTFDGESFKLGGTGSDLAVEHSNEKSVWKHNATKEQTVVDYRGFYRTDSEGNISNNVINGYKYCNYVVKRPQVRNGAIESIVLPEQFKGKKLDVDFTVTTWYGDIDSDTGARFKQDAIRNIFIKVIGYDSSTRTLRVQPCLQKIGLKTLTYWGWDSATTTSGNTIGEGSIDVIVMVQM